MIDSSNKKINKSTVIFKKVDYESYNSQKEVQSVDNPSLFHLHDLNRLVSITAVIHTGTYCMF